MSDANKVYQQARLMFQRLSPKDGDVITVQFPDDIAHEQMAVVAKMLEPLQREFDVTIICLRQGVHIHSIPEHKMNEMGWFRFDPHKPN